MARISERLGANRYAADEHYASALRAFQAGNLTEAQKWIERAIALLPAHAEYHAMQGWLYLEQEECDLAGIACERALELNPYEMLGNYGLGILAYREKDWERSSTFFLNALAAHPDRGETLYYLALVSHRLGNNRGALQRMAEAEGAFESSGDQRSRQCQAWAREFEKLIDTEVRDDKP